MLGRGERRYCQKQSNKESIIGLSLTIFVTAVEESDAHYYHKERGVLEKSLKSSHVADIAAD
jgi:hypothetical protein